MRLREQREKVKFSQIELAEKIGVTQNTISQWETGTRRPNVDMLVKLTEVFGCTADELLGIDRSSRNNEELVRADITRSASGQELLGIDRKKPKQRDETPETRESFAEIVQRRKDEARRGAE